MSEDGALQSLCLAFLFIVVDEKNAERETSRAFHDFKQRRAKIPHSPGVAEQLIVSILNQYLSRFNFPGSWGVGEFLDRQDRFSSPSQSKNLVQPVLFNKKNWNFEISSSKKYLNFDLGPWMDFRKNASQEEFISVLSVLILKIPIEYVARGLKVSQGTVRTRLSLGLERLSQTLVSVGDASL